MTEQDLTLTQSSSQKIIRNSRTLKATKYCTLLAKSKNPDYFCRSCGTTLLT